MVVCSFREFSRQAKFVTVKAGQVPEEPLTAYGQMQAMRRDPVQKEPHQTWGFAVIAVFISGCLPGKDCHYP